MQAKKRVIISIMWASLFKWVPVEDNFGEIFPDKKQALHALILH